MNTRPARIDVVFVITNEISLRFLRSIIVSLADRGCAVGLITNFDHGEPDPDISPYLARHAHVPMRREPKPIMDLIHVVKLRRAIKAMRPKLVHTSTPKAGLLGSIAARSLRLPVIYQVRGYRAEGVRGPFGLFLRMIERFVLLSATHVIFESPSLELAMARDGCNAVGKSVVLGFGSSVGVDTERFSPRRHNTREGAPICGFIGRIHRDKGVEDLLEVFGSVRNVFPGAELLIVGGADPADTDGRRLEALCRGAEGARVTGFVDDVVPYLQSMDVMISPTRREGLPVAPLEAQACGVPVVGYAVTGMIDAVEHGTGGYLVPENDRDSLAHGVVQILGDHSLRERIGASGRAFVRSRFDSGLVTAIHVDHLVRQIAYLSIEPDQPTGERCSTP